MEMTSALAYLGVAAVGIVVTSLILRRPPARPGLDYFRAGLICSSALLLGQVLAFVIFGVWVLPLLGAVVIGFLIPGAMRLVT